MKKRSIWRRIWHFLWEDNSVWSWIANIAIAFVLIKFIVYPGMGFILQTQYPVVAVVSGSMEHKAVADGVGAYNICGRRFAAGGFLGRDDFWNTCGTWYVNEVNISREQFWEFPYRNGFNTGDIMFLRGVKEGEVRLGDILVYRSGFRADPIIHRVVRITQGESGLVYQTKGDHNPGSNSDEVAITHDRVLGRAVARIPYLGYVKIAAVKMVQKIVGVWS